MDQLKELTIRGVILGAVITIVFTASNIYLGLKAGLTFSSAIPAAVISMAVLKLFKKSTILENNMVQTQASAAGTLSSIIFVLPGLIMIGYWQQFHFGMTFLICAAGGMLGVLFSIPLRQAMVVHSTLPYPEGVAAAEILKAGCKEESTENDKKIGAMDILFGGLLSAVVTFFSQGFKFFAESASSFFVVKKSIFQLPIGFNLALLSAGYLIGITAGIAILVGMLMAWGVAVPVLSSLHYESIAGLSLGDAANTIWAKYIRFIGAGILAIASLWTLLTLIKPVVEGVKSSFKMISSSPAQREAQVERTERDMNPKHILLILGAMFIILFFTFEHFIAQSGLSGGFAWTLVAVCVVLAFVIGFLVAAACGYMAGLVGSSSSPISGIGIIAVIVISIVLAALGKYNEFFATKEGSDFATALALFTTSVILAIASISNDNLQDLKTGYIVKATPWKQQVALLIGCVVGALVIAPVLELVYNAYGFSGAPLPREGMNPAETLSAPQATLMSSIATGILSNQLDWSMLILGLIIGAAVIVFDIFLKMGKSSFRLPALAVGMGVYLPPSITTPIFIGSLIAWFIQSRTKKMKLNDEDSQLVHHKATLIASGFIVGGSLIGVLLAMIIVSLIYFGLPEDSLSIAYGIYEALGIPESFIGYFQEILGLLVFLLMCFIFIRRSLSIVKK